MRAPTLTILLVSIFLLPACDRDTDEAVEEIQAPALPDEGTDQATDEEPDEAALAPARPDEDRPVEPVGTATWGELITQSGGVLYFSTPNPTTPVIAVDPESLEATPMISPEPVIPLVVGEAGLYACRPADGEPCELVVIDGEGELHEFAELPSLLRGSLSVAGDRMVGSRRHEEEGAVMSISLDAEAPEVLFEGPMPNRTAITDDGRVFWTSMAASAPGLQSLGPDETEPTVFYQRMIGPVVAHGEDLYFAARAEIFHLPKATEAPHRIATGEGAIAALAIAGDSLYFAAGRVCLDEETPLGSCDPEDQRRVLHRVSLTGE